VRRPFRSPETVAGSDAVATIVSDTGRRLSPDRSLEEEIARESRKEKFTFADLEEIEDE
jgi:hypothetical protein